MYFRTRLLFCTGHALPCLLDAKAIGTQHTAMWSIWGLFVTAWPPGWLIHQTPLTIGGGQEPSTILCRTAKGTTSRASRRSETGSTSLLAANERTGSHLIQKMPPTPPCPAKQSRGTFHDPIKPPCLLHIHFIFKSCKIACWLGIQDAAKELKAGI